MLTEMRVPQEIDNGFIRNMILLYRGMDGWGATWKNKSFLHIRNCFFEKLAISVFGKIAGKVHFTEEVYRENTGKRPNSTPTA